MKFKNLFLIILALHSLPLSGADTDSVLVKVRKNSEQHSDIFGCRWEQHQFKFSIKNRDEIFYSRSTGMFSASALDQVLWAQGIWDLLAEFEIFNQAVTSKLNLRNKYQWGNPESIVITSTTPIKIADSVVGEHLHYLSKQLFWLRDGWLDLNLNKALGVETVGTQHFKLGLFPFELGRGIALGSAYAASAGLLGFYADSIVDQNTPGCLLYGDLLKNILTYDIYLGILRNWTDNFGRVNEKIYTNQLNRYRRGGRGFGHVNFVYANRLKWSPINQALGNRGALVVEPYFMYHRDPEQQVAFPADASSNLLTAGLATDYDGPRLQFGFEWAVNFGHQTVHGWDSNKIDIVANSDGLLTERYTTILTSDPHTNTNPAQADATSTNQAIVAKSILSPTQNCGSINNSDLYNAPNRFRAPYKNKYHGAMLVADASWIFNPKLRVSATLGWATGDESPNHNLSCTGYNQVDHNYQGFIGLQEIYSGKRVISLFVIGENAISRPLSSSSTTNNEFPVNTAGFTNLVYGGTALTGNSQFCANSLDWNLGVLSYWQDCATKRYDLNLQRSIDRLASKHLGTELNLTLTTTFLKALKGFLVTGIFMPGEHYTDIRGKPLSATDIETLTELNADQYILGQTPLLGTQPAFVLNFGFEYAF